MKALIKEGGAVHFAHAPNPRVSRSDDVLIEVALAGLCRTDVYVAEGRIPSRDPVILGHEFSGIVIGVGHAVEHIAVGDRVTAMPDVSCRSCSGCCGSLPAQCHRPLRLGIDYHGAFAQQIVVPSEVVYALPDSVSFMHGAYVEPMAASLAVLNAPIKTEGRGLVYGANRIAELTHRVLVAHGFDNVSVYNPVEDGPIRPSMYDFIVETMANRQAIGNMIDGLRPGGTLVLKSRPPEAVSIDLRSAVYKDLNLKAVNYGPVEHAIELLSSQRLSIDDMLGTVHPLSDYQAVFSGSLNSEGTKIFFGPNGIGGH